MGTLPQTKVPGDANKRAVERSITTHCRGHALDDGAGLGLAFLALSVSAALSTWYLDRHLRPMQGFAWDENERGTRNRCSRGAGGWVSGRGKAGHGS